MHNVPLPGFSRRGIFSLWALITLAACVSNDKGGVPPESSVLPSGAQTGGQQAGVEGSILFHNRTPFTVHLARGSGRVDTATLGPAASSNPIPNGFEKAETYYPVFDVPLTASFSITGLRPASIDMHYQIDNRQERQEVEITLPAGFDDNRAYVVFTNNTKSGGVSLSRNESPNRMTGINFKNAKDNINAGETMVFRENPRDVRFLRVNPGNIRFGELSYRTGFVYYFALNGAAVTLTDARPLHRAGENSWALALDRADAAPLLIPGVKDPAVMTAMLSPSGGAHTLRVFNSAGAEQGGAVSIDSGFTIRAAVPAGPDAVLIAGSQEMRGGDHVPIAEIRRADGTARSELDISTRNDCRSAFFTSAAAKDQSAWLIAGGAGERAALGHGAYLRMIREDGPRLVCDWELGPDDFKAKAPAGIVCQEIVSLAYDAPGGRWLAAGYYERGGGPEEVSFIAEISGQGVIQKITLTEYLFNTIRAGADGSYYLAGQEWKGGGSYALAVKYNAQGEEQWRQKNQPPSHSFYQDAVLDEANQRLVLAGTMRARADSGAGGLPFTEAADMGSGALLWREDAQSWRKEAPSLPGGIEKTALVCGIALAPDYGYALVLSDNKDGVPVKPFMAARVNSQGRFITNLQQ